MKTVKVDVRITETNLAWLKEHREGKRGLSPLINRILDACRLQDVGLVERLEKLEQLLAEKDLDHE